MTDQDVDIDEATTQTITKDPNTNIIDEAIEYNVTDSEFITENDVTTISRNEDSKNIDHINIVLSVSFLVLFFALVCFLLFLWKEYKLKTDLKTTYDVVFSVRPVNILIIYIL